MKYGWDTFRCKMLLRYHKGIFCVQNVFEPITYDEIKGSVTSAGENNYKRRAHIEDQGLDHHPPWAPLSPYILQRIHDYINTTDIAQIFGYQGPVSLDCLSASFILKYTPDQTGSHRTALSFHNDISRKGKDYHIMSIVYTIKSEDCIGGAVMYSRREDGTQQFTDDVLPFIPNDNSIYVMNGDFAAHCAMGISRGYRYSVVLFYETPQTFVDVVSLWNDDYRKDLICVLCGRCMSEKKYLRRHLRDKHSMIATDM